MAPTRDSSMDYSHVSDEDLGQMLINFGVNVGPVNGATRKTYERKLFKLQTGQESPPAQQFEEVEDDDDDEVQLRVPQVSSPRPPVVSHPEPVQPRLRRDIPDSSSYSPRVESRAGLNSPRKTTSLYSENRPASRPVQRTPSPPQESKGIPSWVKIIAMLIVVVLIYLIYSNMEPQVVSSIPGVSHKTEV